MPEETLQEKIDKLQTSADVGFDPWMRRDSYDIDKDIPLSEQSQLGLGNLASADSVSLADDVTGDIGDLDGDLDDVSDGSTYKRVDSVDSSHNITANSIATNAVTSVKINVSTLSAITANVGTLTAGTITGLVLQTSASANTGVKMSSALGGIDVYGQNALDFRDTSGGLVGTIFGSSGNFKLRTDDGAGTITFEASGGLVSDGIVTADGFTTGSATGSIKAKNQYGGEVFEAPHNGSNTDVYISSIVLTNHIFPDRDGFSNLGSATKEFNDLYIDGTANIDSLVADTADINGGTLDGVDIGNTVIGAGQFTALYVDEDAEFSGEVDASSVGVIAGTLRINQTPAAATPTPTHTIAINCNGTSYDFPCIAT